MRSRWLVMLVCGFAMGAGVVLLADPGGGSSSASATGIAPITGTSTGIAPIGQNAPGQPHNHDELAELVPDKRLTATERATLADQLTRARAVAMRYPTVADAVAAGHKRSGGFAPGAGAHYIAGYALSGPGVVDVEHPLALIYDGVSPTVARTFELAWTGARVELRGGEDRVHGGRHRDSASGRCRGHRAAVCEGRRLVHAPDRVDAARVGGARVREQGGRVLTRQPRPAVRRRDRQHQHGRFLPRDVSIAFTSATRRA